MILFALLACGSPPLAPADPEPPVEVRDWLDGVVRGSGGTLVVQLETDASFTADVALPEVHGLSFTAGEPRVERFGDRVVSTTRWSFSGKPGHYEIPALVAVGVGPNGEASAISSPLFIDIATKPVTTGKMVDIAEPPPLWRTPRVLIAGAVGAAALLAGGLWLAFRGLGRRAPPPVPIEPPDVLALRAWAAIRTDPALTDHERALALSRIFREYTEAVLHFPAAKYSTTETLRHLAELPHLEDGNLPRAKRLLQATDRVKYAGDQPGGDLFDELDADLRAFVSSTRPYTWVQA